MRTKKLIQWLRLFPGAISRKPLGNIQPTWIGFSRGCGSSRRNMISRKMRLPVGIEKPGWQMEGGVLLIRNRLQSSAFVATPSSLSTHTAIRSESDEGVASTIDQAFAASVLPALRLCQLFGNPCNQPLRQRLSGLAPAPLP